VLLVWKLDRLSRRRVDVLGARKRGLVGGGLPKLRAHQRAKAMKMVNSGDKTASKEGLFGVHRSTISRLIAKNLPQTEGLQVSTIGSCEVKHQSQFKATIKPQVGYSENQPPSRCSYSLDFRRSCFSPSTLGLGQDSTANVMVCWGLENLEWAD
jgi:hypothetical protein